MDTDLDTELEQELVLCLCRVTKQKLERKRWLLLDPNPYKSVQSQVMKTAITPALHRADHSYNGDVKE